jgi:quercetin dioxygenase-like cupin family protein
MILDRTRAERKDRLDAGTLHAFALSDYADALRQEEPYITNGKNGLTLVKTPGLRVVLEVMRRGAELPEHRAPGPITLQVLEGEVRFTAGEEVYRIREGEALALPAGRPHAVEAVCDSAFLLTIAPQERKGEGSG